MTSDDENIKEISLGWNSVSFHHLQHKYSSLAIIMNYRRVLKKLIQKTKVYKKMLFGSKSELSRSQVESDIENRRFSYSSADFTIIEDIEMYRQEFMQDDQYELVGNYNEEVQHFDFQSYDDDAYEIIEYKSSS